MFVSKAYVYINWFWRICNDIFEGVKQGVIFTIVRRFQWVLVHFQYNYYFVFIIFFLSLSHINLKQFH